MNESKVPVDRRQVMIDNLRMNAKAQKTADNREHYFKSCEAHGGDLAALVALVRPEFDKP